VRSGCTQIFVNQPGISHRHYKSIDVAVRQHPTKCRLRKRRAILFVRAHVVESRGERMGRVRRHTAYYRDYSSQCVLVTAHGKDGAKEPDWQSLARSGQTLVFYMSRVEAGSSCRKLIDHGLPPATSAALIADGTRVTQEVITATVATLSGVLAGRKIDAPALISSAKWRVFINSLRGSVGLWASS